MNQNLIQKIPVQNEDFIMLLQFIVVTLSASSTLLIKELLIAQHQRLVLRKARLMHQLHARHMLGHEEYTDGI